MSWTAPALEATIMTLSQRAPKTWARIVETAIDVDQDELAVLQALPCASSLLDGNVIRVVGLANAIMHAVDDSIDGQMRALQSEVTRLRAMV